MLVLEFLTGFHTASQKAANSGSIFRGLSPRVSPCSSFQTYTFWNQRGHLKINRLLSFFQFPPARVAACPDSVPQQRAMPFALPARPGSKDAQVP